MADAGHKRFGSKLLARGGRREVVEGKMRARNVLREFNSYDEALAYYHGPDYSRAHPLREPHSVCDFVIVEGYDGPQPPPIGTPPAPAPLKGYWIVHVDVTDPEGYKPYQAANATPFGKFGARFLVRGGRCEVMEGQPALALRGAGISELRGGARLLSFAGLPGGEGAARRQGRGRSRRHRGCRRQLTAAGAKHGQGLLDRARRGEQRGGLQALRGGQPGDLQEVRRQVRRARRQVRVPGRRRAARATW